jgi:hypothetical protein
MKLSKQTLRGVGFTVVLIAPLLVLADTPAFVPLSDIPAIKNLGGAPDIAAFFNALYKIAIGAAVVIAVLQLVRAGITYSMSDAITSKEEAKHLMLVSILGLVLVLSPAIVFSVINPEILNIKIDAGKLQLNPLKHVDTSKAANVTGTAKEAENINSCTATPGCTVQRTRVGKGDISQCVCSTKNNSTADADACSAKGTGSTKCEVEPLARTAGNCVCRTTLTPSTAEGPAASAEDPEKKCVAEGGEWIGVSRAVAQAYCKK